jgi:hypothetical protein
VAEIAAMAARAVIHACGREQQPVVVIDDFLPDPAALVDEAATLAFAPIGAHYPGVRAPVPAARLEGFMPALAAPIARVFGLGPRLRLLEAYYSLVTTPPGSLTTIQRLPHFDGLERARIALLLFLGAPGTDAGGTAFYRHRATGFESVDESRFAVYREALARDIARCGVPGPGYIAGSTPIFEQLLRLPGHHNRALVYRGHLLHCADIPASLAYANDPRRGRLTLNLFLSGD